MNFTKMAAARRGRKARRKNESARKARCLCLSEEISVSRGGTEREEANQHV